MRGFSTFEIWWDTAQPKTIPFKFHYKFFPNVSPVKKYLHLLLCSVLQTCKYWLPNCNVYQNHLQGLCSTLRDSASPDLGQQPKRSISSKFPGVAAVLLDQGPLSETPWAKGFTRTNSLNPPKDTLSKMRTALAFKSYRPELECLLYQKSWKVTIFGG